MAGKPSNKIFYREYERDQAESTHLLLAVALSLSSIQTNAHVHRRAARPSAPTQSGEQSWSQNLGVTQQLESDLAVGIFFFWGSKAQNYHTCADTHTHADEHHTHVFVFLYNRRQHCQGNTSQRRRRWSDSVVNKVASLLSTTLN